MSVRSKTSKKKTRGNRIDILYLCDRRACPKGMCSWPMCRHTSDIDHAVNFESVAYADGVFYSEKIEEDR